MNSLRKYNLAVPSPGIHPKDGIICVESHVYIRPFILKCVIVAIDLEGYTKTEKKRNVPLR